MIVKNLDDSNQLIFTNNITADINSICSTLGYVKKNGDLYKGVDIISGNTYYPSNSDVSLQSTKISYKKVTSIVLDKKIELVTNVSNINKNDGTKISINKSASSNSDITRMHNFIHKMSMDNGRMLYPVLKRFSNTIHLFKGNKSLLTGYIKLDDYLYIMKMPQSGIKNIVNTSDCAYNITLNSDICEIEVTDVVSGNIKYSFNFNGSLSPVSNNGKFNPYVLFTTTPITMQNQKMPFQTVTVNGLHVFITPLLFSNSDTLTKLKGGINLLS